MLAHVGEEPDVERTPEVDFVGDAQFSGDVFLGRPVAHDLVLVRAILRILTSHLDHGAAQGRRAGHGEGRLREQAGVGQEWAAGRADDGHALGEELRVEATHGFQTEDVDDAIFRIRQAGGHQLAARVEQADLAARLAAARPGQSVEAHHRRASAETGIGPVGQGHPEEAGHVNRAPTRT